MGLAPVSAGVGRPRYHKTPAVIIGAPQDRMALVGGREPLPVRKPFASAPAAIAPMEVGMKGGR